MAVNRGRRFLLRFSCLLVSVVCAQLHGYAQNDTTDARRRNLAPYLIGAGAAYGAGMAVLHHVWYKDTDRQSFRFFNDNAEWKQVDKAGHFYASFHLGNATATALTGLGVKAPHARLAGALTGFLLTLPVEIMDGYSTGYGASAGDIVANAAGPALSFAQHLAWGQIRIQPKFSFHRTGYAPQRPALLGDNLLSEIFKDYNGQTYWLSIDADKFMRFPAWLNIAAGYGAQHMIYARDAANRAAGFHPVRQYYLSPDLDLTGLRTRSKFVKTLIFIASAIKIPAPALEFSSEGLKFRPLYF